MILLSLLSFDGRFGGEHIIGTLSSLSPPPQVAVPKPLVSFVIPSTLTRDALNMTIESLLSQSETNWEAIIGVDTTISTYKNPDLIESRRWHFKQDPRLQWVPIDVNSTNRGRNGNGAGDIRNTIIRHHAAADWVAFIDDDDSLSPSYIELLQEGRQLHEDMDIFIFRMLLGAGRIIPPYRHGLVAAINNVGISFAVRKDLFERSNSSILFTPHQQEDYYFLRNAQELNATIKLSCNVTYFIRQPPKSVKPHDACEVGNAFLSSIPPQENLGINESWSESSLRWQLKQNVNQSQ